MRFAVVALALLAVCASASMYRVENAVMSHEQHAQSAPYSLFAANTATMMAIQAYVTPGTGTFDVNGFKVGGGSQAFGSAVLSTTVPAGNNLPFTAYPDAQPSQNISILANFTAGSNYLAAVNPVGASQVHIGAIVFNMGVIQTYLAKGPVYVVVNLAPYTGVFGVQGKADTLSVDPYLDINNIQSVYMDGSFSGTFTLNIGGSTATVSHTGLKGGLYIVYAYGTGAPYKLATAQYIAGNSAFARTASYGLMALIALVTMAFSRLF